MADRQQYFRALESLRGIAALIVALLHVGWLNALYPIGLIRNGAFMVDFFFVLSGFVICHSAGPRLQARSDVGRFMFLRFCRLFPLHFVFLMVFVGIETTKYIAEIQFGFAGRVEAFPDGFGGIFLGNVFLVHALGFFDRLSFNVPSWSISTEFYAYLLFAMTFLLIRRSSSRIVASIALAAIGAGLILAFNSGSSIDTEALPRFGFARCVTGFFIGVLIYQLFTAIRRSNGVLAKPRVLDAAATIFLVAVTCMAFFSRGSALEIAILPLFGGLILSLAAYENGIVGRILKTSPLLWLGKVSYSIYMVHFSLAWGFSYFLRYVLEVPLVADGLGYTPHETGPILGNALLVAYLFALLTISHFTYTFIEDKYRKMGKAWADRRYGPTGTRRFGGDQEQEKTA